MKKKKGILYFCFYFFYFAGHSVPLTYLNVYLEKYLGLTGSQLGRISGISLLLCVVLIPVWGMIGDRTRAYKSLLVGFLLAVITFTFLLSKQTAFIGALIFCILIEVSRSGINPMADTLAMDYTAHHGGNFGLYRSGGSIGWMIAALTVGLLANSFGLDHIIFNVYILLLTCALVFVFLFPRISALKAESSKKAQKGNLRTLFQNKRYVFLMFVSLTTGMVADGIGSYSGNHIIFTLGGNELQVSLNSLCQTFPEFLYMLIFTSLILPKLGYKKVYLMSAAALTIRFAIYFIAGSPYIFMLGTLLHLFTITCTTAGNLAFMRQIVPEENYGTAATLMFSANTLGRAFYGYIGGQIYELLGSRYIYLFVMIEVAIVLLVELKSKLLDIPYQKVVEE
ncbi:MAG: MFS transporter [Lachnospiraceae bacterium]|nr:MFS transporter [Lachnospiraceae bacterium]